MSEGEVRDINVDVNGAEGMSEGEVGDNNVDVNGAEDMSGGEYDNTLDVVFQYSNEDNDGLVEEDITHLLGYDKEAEGKDKKHSEEYECASEELESGCETDDESNCHRKKYHVFKMPQNMLDYKWELGTYFAAKNDFKEAITSYAVQLGRDLRFSKNDKQRVRVICKEGCDWNAYCGKLPYEDSWKLRKLVDKHNCSGSYNMKLMTTKWLSKRIQKSLKDNPNLKIRDIKEKAQRKLNVGVSKTKAISVRCATRGLVDVSFLEQYTIIYDYAHEILKINPGSTIKINVQPVPDNVSDSMSHFQRIYIYYATYKESFKLCRPIIGLDGCFFKGLCGGQILEAIERNPNDQMMPIAFAIVEGETKDSWT
ncbi:uncharacterized protein LOC127130666 [Lathyrus oleraceus]|uniref:uncharacterized protein LOC127130666 n=1 Tax=Pisum sativum TaxID=3888 RepID=UPI0021D1F506|nr:uncharacterized protein LOC127130666 [Pisum sativum]